jgi:hypothetical protein
VEDDDPFRHACHISKTIEPKSKIERENGKKRIFLEMQKKHYAHLRNSGRGFYWAFIKGIQNYSHPDFAEPCMFTRYYRYEICNFNTRKDAPIAEKIMQHCLLAT